MKTLKTLLWLCAIGACSLKGSLRAGDSPPSPPPVVVEKDKDTNKLPPDVKTLLQTFEAKRDAYQRTQKALMVKLHEATPEQRQAIRDQLQDNRQTFLAQIREFREELREEVREMKGKLNNPELNRLFDSKTDPGSGRHKGQR